MSLGTYPVRKARDLAKLGWRMPETAAEVRAAEEWVAKSPSELPQRLQATPDIARSDDRSAGEKGILSRYLRDDSRTPDSPSGDRSMDADRSDLEPER